MVVYGDHCETELKALRNNNQSACINATECFKNDTQELRSHLQELSVLSKELSDQMKKYVEGTAECENNKAYARKSPNSTRWKNLAEECANYYYETGNTLVKAKRNLNLLDGNKRVKLENDIQASEASLTFIKRKCNP